MKQSKSDISSTKTSSQGKQLGAKAVKPSTTTTSAKSTSKAGSKTKSTGGIGGSSTRGQSASTSGYGGTSSIGGTGGIGGGSVRSTSSQTGSLGGTTTGGKSNSISFGAVNFDSQKNLLKVRTTQGNSQILCCITGDALRECFHAGTSAQELEKSFHQHEREIQYCAQQKIQNKQWKIPNQEILLNTQDLRQYTK